MPDMKKEKTMLQQHYTPKQLAERWGCSEEFVRKLFKAEPDVMVIDRPEKMHKRGHTTLRIPESVAERVYARLVNMKRPTLTAVARLAEAEKRA